MGVAKHTFKRGNVMAANATLSTQWLSSEFPELSNIVPLARGGQKEVFSAAHVSDGDVVLKIMHPTADLERTRREVMAVSNVGSARVPKILAEGTLASPLGNCLWFREQRIQGVSVRTRLNAGPFQPSELLRLALHVSETLVESERVNIVHRDVKPENIIVDPSETYWLIDFGLARHLNLTSLTASGSPFGNVTWGYAPLEQCRNIKQDIDARADLFALGVTVYECGTGHNPLRSGARDQLEVLRRLEAGNFPQLQMSFNSTAELQDLVASLTQKNRIHRPRSAQEAYEWIKDICDKEQVQ